MKKKKYCVIGVMSGTSMDSIDISIIKSDGINNYKHLSSKYFSYSKSTLHLLSRCNKLFAMNKKNIELLYECEQSVTKDYISALKKFIILFRGRVLVAAGRQSFVDFRVATFGLDWNAKGKRRFVIFVIRILMEPMVKMVVNTLPL